MYIYIIFEQNVVFGLLFFCLMLFWSENIVYRNKMSQKERKLPSILKLMPNITKCEETFQNYDRKSENEEEMCKPAKPAGDFDKCLRKC